MSEGRAVPHTFQGSTRHASPWMRGAVFCVLLFAVGCNQGGAPAATATDGSGVATQGEQAPDQLAVSSGLSTAAQNGQLGASEMPPPRPTDTPVDGSGLPIATTTQAAFGTYVLDGRWGRAASQFVLPELRSAFDARRIVGLQQHDEAVTVLTAEPATGGATWRVWRAPLNPDGRPGPLQRIDEELVLAATASAPVAVPVRDGGFVMVKPTDNLSLEGANASLFARRIWPNGRIDDTPTPVAMPGDVQLFREWQATAMQGAALVCFAGRVSPTHADDYLCGRLGVEGNWEVPPRSVFRDVRGAPWARTPTADVQAVGLALGSTSSDQAMVMYYVQGGGHDRIYGVLLQGAQPPDSASLSVQALVDLTGEALSVTGPFRHRRAPLAMSTAAGTGYALAGWAGSHARAGFVLPDGTMPDGKMQIAEPGSYAERPLMVEVQGRPWLLYDDYGNAGERTVVTFGNGRPQGAGLAAPVGTDPVALAARNGWAGSGWLAMVIGETDGVVVIGPMEALGAAPTPVIPPGVDGE